MKVDVINEDELKSTESKKIWAPFLESWKAKYDMYNYLTMLRLDCKKDYTQDNTCVGKSIIVIMTFLLSSPKTSIFMYRVIPFEGRIEQKHQIGRLKYWVYLNTLFSSQC
jgi:hypothetical protein